MHINNIIIIMEEIINNIIEYQKENNITRMCGPTVTWLFELSKYWFKNIHVNVKPSIVICMKGGQQIILSGHINIIINGVFFDNLNSIFDFLINSLFFNLRITNKI